MIVPALSHDELVDMILDATDRPERRHHRRRRVRRLVRVHTDAGEWRAHTVDLSAGGILLELTDEALPAVPAKLEVTFGVPGTDRQITLDARPVRLLASASGTRPPPLVAAVFLHRDADSVHELETALAEWHPAENATDHAA